MTTARTPGVEDFHAFFQSRIRNLPPKGELVWMSNQVPVEALAAGYPLGIFPWPGDDPECFPWVMPRRRGVLPVDKFHLGKSTRRAIRRSGFDVTCNQAFVEVMQACHEAHQPESWIHPLMQEAYRKAHRAGFAHSVEVWQAEELVGGLYGVDSGLFFSGESMFHRRDNAGKLAVQILVERCRIRGDSFVDIQQLTPHMKALGAEAWNRQRFQKQIATERHNRIPDFF